MAASDDPEDLAAVHRRLDELERALEGFARESRDLNSRVVAELKQLLDAVAGAAAQASESATDGISDDEDGGDNTA